MSNGLNSYSPYMAVPPTGSCTWNCPFKRKWLSHVAQFRCHNSQLQQIYHNGSANKHKNSVMLTALYCSNREKMSVGSGEWLQLANNREIQEVKTFSRRFFFFFNLFSLSVKVNVCYFISYFRWIYDKTQFCNIFPFPPIYFYLIGRSKISLLKIKLRARP